MNNRLRLMLAFGILALFAVAGMLTLHTDTPTRAIGALLVGAGLISIWLAHGLEAAQDQSTRAPSNPRYQVWLRPLTLTLWGSGVALLGLLQLIIF